MKSSILPTLTTKDEDFRSSNFFIQRRTKPSSNDIMILLRHYFPILSWTHCRGLTIVIISLTLSLVTSSATPQSEPIATQLPQREPIATPPPQKQPIGTPPPKKAANWNSASTEAANWNAGLTSVW